MSLILTGNSSTLTVDSTSGITFPTGSGAQAAPSKILQVINATYSTSTTTTGTTLVDSGLTANITPLFSTSRILVVANMSGLYNGATANTGLNLWVVRNSTTIVQFAGITNYLGSANTLLTCAGTSYLDSPATTSTTTYKVQFARILGSGTVGVQNNNDTSTLTLMEVAA